MVHLLLGHAGEKRLRDPVQRHVEALGAAQRVLDLLSPGHVADAAQYGGLPVVIDDAGVDLHRDHRPVFETVLRLEERHPLPSDQGDTLRNQAGVFFGSEIREVHREEFFPAVTARAPGRIVRLQYPSPLVEDQDGIGHPVEQFGAHGQFLLRLLSLRHVAVGDATAEEVGGGEDRAAGMVYPALLTAARDDAEFDRGRGGGVGTAGMVLLEAVPVLRMHQAEQQFGIGEEFLPGVAGQLKAAR